MVSICMMTISPGNVCTIHTQRNTTKPIDSRSGIFMHRVFQQKIVSDTPAITKPDFKYEVGSDLHCPNKG